MAIQQSSVYCSDCGRPSPAGRRFCSRCGARLDQPGAGYQTPGAPRPMTHPAVPTQASGSPPEQVVRYAGFGPRLGAFVIDAMILWIPCSVVGFILLVPATAPAGSIVGALYPFLYMLLCVAGLSLYFALFESSGMQATPGKRVFGLQVTDIHGNRLSFGRSAGRNLAKVVSTMIGYVGFVMIVFTAREQALHDIIADALVVRQPER